MTAETKKILYLVTEDWAFLSHRLPMARAAKEMGLEVHVACRVQEDAAAIRQEGFTLHPLAHFDRGSTNPFKELRAIWEILRLYKKVKPDLVHHVALKPVLYGSLASLFTSIPARLNAMIGLGFLFTGEGSFATKCLRRGVVTSLRFLLNQSGAKLLVQNEDDKSLFVKQRIINEKNVALIPGSGVSCETYQPLSEPEEAPIRAVFVGRLLWDKGVGELVRAAEILKDTGVRITLVGSVDPDNPRSISEDTLRRWLREGHIDWWGVRSDIVGVWAAAHIAVLPSYREGLPKSLLEAAACARPLIATDVPGCRALVKDGENGLLVPGQDAEALAAAIDKLAQDPALRKKLGQEARKQVEEIYDAKLIAQQIQCLYRDMLP